MTINKPTNHDSIATEDASKDTTENIQLNVSENGEANDESTMNDFLVTDTVEMVTPGTATCNEELQEQQTLEKVRKVVEVKAFLI